MQLNGSGVSRVGLRVVSKSHKFKWLVKVGASKGVIRVYLNKSWPGGFPGNQKPPLDTPLNGNDYAWMTGGKPSSPVFKQCVIGLCSWRSVGMLHTT